MATDTPRHLRIPAGAIHGRFQPFHKGHMRYLLLALEQAENVTVQITNPGTAGTAEFEPTDPVRHSAAHNPLTYLQRAEIIQAAVRRHPDLDHRRVHIVPFDVSSPIDGWPDITPTDTVQFVCAHEDWDNEKAKRFDHAGYPVRFLPTQDDRVTATLVRTLYTAGDQAWRTLVPDGTADLIDSMLGTHQTTNDDSHDSSLGQPA